MASHPELGPRTAEALGTLTVDEKAALSAGSGFFTMAGVTRLGIAGWGTTDGPNGARGASLLGSGESKATCVPCGTALGASWDPALVEELGVLLGDETRTKASRVLLAPTVNLHRSPLSGRNFECFSEDPLLTGVLAAAYIRGVQSRGVVTTVKHFVGNECETDRYTSNSVIDDRALRELYLLPFEYAVKEGGTLGVMTSYNRLNGRYCTNLRWLLDDVLRGEWGFEGFVVTDWFAALDTVEAAEAGLDLEMPAGDRAYGTKLAAAVHDGRVPESALDAISGRLLTVFERINAWNDEPLPEQSIDREDHRALARRASASSMVLLRNEPSGSGAPLLPLAPASLKRIAVIGPNAARSQMMGGGSANLRPFHRTTPLDAIRARLGGVCEIVHEAGCDIDMSAPLLSGAQITAPNGEQGFAVEVFDNLELAGEPVGTTNRDTSRILFMDEALPGVRLAEMGARATTVFTPSVSGEHIFELMQVVPTRVTVDGTLVLDGVTTTPPHAPAAFFGMGAGPVHHRMDLVAGTGYRIVIEMIADAAAPMRATDLRVRAPQPADPIGSAAAAAATADVAVVIVGTNDDWETEGADRASLSLPGDQNALIDAVLAANPNTVVVVNTGGPVTMPWADRVPAIIQSWFGGQEMADALVDVLTGETDPGGRLPTTYPVRVEHNPSYGNFPGDNGDTVYAEGIFIGYRWYEARHLPVLFPFGHGLSYTTFDVGAPVAPERAGAGDTVTVDVPVTNTGTRRGSHVVQCYVRPHGSRIVRPVKELKAFAKVTLDPGDQTSVRLTLDARSFSYWDPAQPDWPSVKAQVAQTVMVSPTEERRTEPGWTLEPGRYDIVIANSAADVVAVTTIELGS